MSGPVIYSSDFARAQQPGVNYWFGVTYDRYPEQYSKLFEVLQSQKAFEEAMSTYGFSGAPVIPQGQDMTYEAVKQGPATRFQHLKVGKGYAITEEHRKDNLYPEIIRDYSMSMGVAIRQTKEQYHANIINSSTNASARTGYDGKELCATNHVLLGGGTASNEFAAVTPFSELALSQMITNIKGLVDDAGQKIQAQPVGLWLPLKLEWEAQRVLNSMGRPNTANNDINVMEGIMPYYLNNYFTSETRWGIKTNVPHGLVSYQREALEMRTSTDFNNNNERFAWQERYCGGWSNWRGYYGNGE